MTEIFTFYSKYIQFAGTIRKAVHCCSRNRSELHIRRFFMNIKAAFVKERKMPIKMFHKEVNMREPLQNEVRIKLVSSGICHTDIAQMSNEWGVDLPQPMVYGHEGAGIVESVGPGVTRFKAGDHVIISNPSCGECDFCKSGQEWLCDRYTDYSILFDGTDRFGTTAMTNLDGSPVYYLFSQGSFAEYVLTNQRTLTKIPEEMDLKVAGPLGCGLRTGAGAVYGTLKPRASEWLVVCGAGAVGLAAVWMAKAMGANVVVTDIEDSRLKVATDTGADIGINTRGMTPEEAGKAIIDAIGRPADFVAECTGFGPSVKTGLTALKAGGHFAQVGVGGQITFDSWWFAPLDSKTITWIRMGSIANDDILGVLCDLYMKGKFPCDMLNAYYSFDNIQQAVDDACAKKVVKPVLLFD